jgi:hypothetical protein
MPPIPALPRPALLSLLGLDFTALPMCISGNRIKPFERG